MNRLLQAFANLFRIEDLRKRVFFTLGLLAVYRIGAYIPTPGINTTVLDQIFAQGAGSVLGIFQLEGTDAGLRLTEADLVALFGRVKWADPLNLFASCRV